MPPKMANLSFSKAFVKPVGEVPWQRIYNAVGYTAHADDCYDFANLIKGFPDTITDEHFAYMMVRI